LHVILREAEDRGTRLSLGVTIEYPDGIPMENRIIVQQEYISAPCPGHHPVVADTVTHVAFADDQDHIGKMGSDKVDGCVRGGIIVDNDLKRQMEILVINGFETGTDHGGAIVVGNTD